MRRTVRIDDLTIAEFAHLDDVTINVDATGAMFFQSAATGCIGNGTLTPHLNRECNVYDTTLTIDGCIGACAGLNTEFEGLATRAVGRDWG